MSTQQEALFEYVLWLADNSLILGQRVAEWCGHGPYLEEDIALTNISLDLIGQARGFYSYAAEIENKGNDEDKLAYFRSDRDFKNNLLLEEPNGDFGQTILKQYFFSVFQKLVFERLSSSTDERIAALAAKSLKETTYHLRHSRQWLFRLGDGTPESHQRIQTTLENLWQLTGDLFENGIKDPILFEAKIAFDLREIKQSWTETIAADMVEATLVLPTNPFMLTGGRAGNHSENLGHILAEMQSLARAIPDGRW